MKALENPWICAFEACRNPVSSKLHECRNFATFCRHLILWCREFIKSILRVYLLFGTIPHDKVHIWAHSRCVQREWCTSVLYFSHSCLDDNVGWIFSWVCWWQNLLLQNLSFWQYLARVLHLKRYMVLFVPSIVCATVGYTYKCTRHVYYIGHTYH